MQKANWRKKREADPTSHYFNRTVPTSKEPKRKNPYKPRHPLQANTQINRTGPTLHIVEPHTEGKYNPARRKSSLNPAPK
jgi:hypothetical protein